jgi:8-oxo-dGTP diphosphatase
MPRPETPALTVDTVIELTDQPSGHIILIERKFPPPGWALPGGFVDIGETVEAAAVREAAEETGLDVTLTHFLGCYSDPARDPRGHTVSVVYVATAAGQPRAMDDAKNVRIFDVLSSTPPQLAFDHDKIIADYIKFKKEKRPVYYQM